MNTKELRDWLMSLPEQFDEYEVILRTVISSENLTDDTKYTVHDQGIVGAGIDLDNNECFVCLLDTYLQLNNQTEI